MTDTEYEEKFRAEFERLGVEDKMMAIVINGEVLILEIPED